MLELFPRRMLNGSVKFGEYYHDVKEYCVRIDLASCCCYLTFSSEFSKAQVYSTEKAHFGRESLNLRRLFFQFRSKSSDMKSGTN